MTPSTAPLKPVNHDNKSVQRILAAALSCFGQRGYHAASLKEIAAEAGVAKSLLHYHFASKEHLLIELEAIYYRQIAQAVRARLATRAPSVEGALDALDQVWDAIVATRSQFPFALEIWRAALSNPAIKERLDAFQAEMLELVEEGVSSALGPLAAQLKLPPARLAALLQLVFQGVSLQLYLTAQVAPVRRTFEDFKQLVRGLLPADERKREPPA
ncbi:MAG TPA: helix-turn-helix domain-containing protein [Polyangia bacterium]|nr:helix-turn-helix domain-containing protein [Polyangia bacterium]